MKILKISIYFCGLIIGLLVYVVTNKTPYFGYQSMIHLFCLTNGRSNDLINAFIKKLRPPVAIDYTGNCGLLKSEVSEATNSLIEKGYYIFEHKLSEEVCNRLLDIT